MEINPSLSELLLFNPKSVSEPFGILPKKVFNPNWFESFRPRIHSDRFRLTRIKNLVQINSDCCLILKRNKSDKWKSDFNRFSSNEIHMIRKQISEWLAFFRIKFLFENFAKETDFKLLNFDEMKLWEAI